MKETPESPVKRLASNLTENSARSENGRTLRVKIRMFLVTIQGAELATGKGSGAIDQITKNVRLLSPIC